MFSCNYPIHRYWKLKHRAVTVGRMVTGGGMYEDLEESDHSNDSIIYRKNVLDKIDPEEENANVPKLKKSGYDAADYENLDIAEDIRDMFVNIQKYVPKDIELETRWKIFVPEYIPSSGDLDVFLKVECDDVNGKDLGLKVLDEPSTHQSDPTIVELHQTSLCQQDIEKSAKFVKKIKSDENFGKQIDKWIDDLAELRTAKPLATVHYKKPMPDVSEVLKVSR